jgi:DNA-binding winged helix-turn-helix (wHTH) protein
LDLKAGELCRNGSKIKLQEQPFQILKLLLERPGEVVTHDEIIRVLWPNGTIVEYEHSVKTAVKKLRHALGDDADTPRYVETLPRHGYRFIYPVENGEAGLASAQPAQLRQSPVASLQAPGHAFGTPVPRADHVEVPEADSAGLVGKNVSHYRLRGVAGKGGMGVCTRLRTSGLAGW